MAITVNAVYENGVLRPTEPLPLKNQGKVRLTIQPELGWAERTSGMLKWTGDVETLDRFTMDVELDLQEGS